MMVVGKIRKQHRKYIVLESCCEAKRHIRAALDAFVAYEEPGGPHSSVLSARKHKPSNPETISRIFLVHETLPSHG